MADEILKRDKNFVTVAAGVTNDASAEVRMLRVDPVTGRVLIDVSGGGGVVTSVNGQTGTVILTTDNVSEGTANKYFTNSRAVTALTGQNISIFTNDSGYLTGSSSGQYKVFYTVGSSNSDYITDGTADNVEIQAAIDAANTAGGGIVYIRKGTYAIASGIALKSKVTVTGEGPTATILTLASGTVIKADTQQYVTLSNLGTNGTSQATNDSSVQVLNSSYVYIEKCNILNANGFGLFINASATNTTSNVWVTKNRITGRGNSDVIGGGPNNSTGAVVSDLYFRDNYVVMDTTISGTYSSAFDIVAVTRVDVQGNHFVGNVTFGFEQFNHRASSISNNNIKPAVGLLAGGVYITANTSETDTDKSLNITGNILDSSEISISAAGSTKKIDGVVITGNTIRPWSTQNGITLNNVTSSIVSGNLVSSGNPAAVFNAAVYLTNSDNITIDGNQFVRCNYGVQDTSNVASVIVGVNGYTSVTTQLKTSGSGLLKYLVASSTAPAATKALADYVCTSASTGNTDDVLITNALTAVSGAGGGIVELSEGNFSTYAAISVPSNVILRGRGIGITTITIASGAGATFKSNGQILINSDVTNGNSNITIQDIEFIGAITGTPTQSGTNCGIYFKLKGNANINFLRLKGSKFNVQAFRIEPITVGTAYVNCLAEDIQTDQATTGAGISFGTQGKNIIVNRFTGGARDSAVAIFEPITATVSNCVIDGSGSSGGQGIEFSVTQNYTADSVVITGNTVKNYLTGSGIYLNHQTNSAVYEPQKFVISNNICSNNAHDGITIQGALSATISNNICFNNTNHGINITSAASGITDNCIFINNQCFNNSQGSAGTYHGININGQSSGNVQNCTFANNRCYDNQATKTQGYGIYMSGDSASLVHDNYINNNILVGNFTGDITTFGTNNHYSGFFGGTNYGLNTTSPTYPLDVTGSLRVNAGDILQTGGNVISNTNSPLYLQTGSVNPIIFRINSVEKARIDSIGNVGIGTASPTAKLHLPAGTATASTAPLKFTSGTLLTTPEAGSVEFDGSHFYGTVGSTRYQFDQQSKIKYLVASSTAPAATKLIADYVCDGTGDDVEINAALTALPANGGTVELTEGTFNISATVNMKGYQQLIGKGFGTILYAVNSLNSNILQMGANTGTNFGMVLKGMYIDGNQNNQTSGHGVKVVGAYVGIIENVWVRYVYGYGLWLTGVSGQAFSAYNLINECLFSDGYKDGSVGIYCDTMSEFNYFKSSNTDFHTGNQSKGIYINSGNNIFIGGQSDYNGYNLYIAGNVHNKFYGYSFDRATYREVWLTGGTQHNIFTACQFGYYVVIPTLATAITAGATITSLNISAGTPQDIPTYGVPIVVDYGNGSAETFTVSSAGAAAGATTIPVNSKVATSSHSTGAYVVQRYRGVDHQGGSGPNFFTNCIWNGNQSLPTNINWDKQVGEDGGTTSVYEGNIFNGGGGVSLQPNSIFSFTNVLGTLITDNPTYLSVKQGGTGAATLTGLVKGNGTSPFTAAVAGTDYQAPLTFSTGLTNTSSTITSNLSVGVTGGQSVIGGSASGNALTLYSTSNATKGLVIIGTSAYDENANKLGVSTQAPTHSLTLASAGNGAAIYNTTDQTTNFERATMTWGGNIFTLATSKGGTGSNRDMTIQSGGNMRITTNSGQSMFIGNDNNPTVNFLTGSTYTGASGVVNVQGTFTATSGIQKPFVVSPTINNSSAGGYTIFTVNPTVTTVGSGATLLADFQIGGTTQAQITAAGWIAAGGITPTSTLHTGGSFARFVRAITALRTLDASDSIILANGTFTVTLPTAVGITGRIYTIKNSGTGTITVGTTSAQTIYTTAGAVSTQSLTTGMSSDVVSDGTNWQAI